MDEGCLTDGLNLGIKEGSSLTPRLSDNRGERDGMTVGESGLL